MGDISAAVVTLKLLADETRLRIIWNLLHGEHSVNELAAHLAMQPAAISHHLAKLRLAGVVTTRRDGNRIFYATRDDHIEAMIQEALRHVDHLTDRSHPHASPTNPRRLDAATRPVDEARR